MPSNIWNIFYSYCLCGLSLVISFSSASSELNNVSDVEDPMVVVVSKKSEIDTLNNKSIANIFLTRTNRFPNGRKAIPIELRGGGLRNVFYQEISGKSPTELTAYWTTLIFSGKGRPPKGYEDIKALIERLEKSPSAISYLPLAQVTNELKVVYQFP